MPHVRALALLLVVACTPATASGSSSAACATDGDLVVVDTRTHVLSLCSGRRAVARIRVALGRGGLEKAREGDGRTPIGSYELGSPRPSARFGTFIPIGYPTARKRERGFTGRNVGIHGPDRRARWLRSASTWVDWTAGCVATGTDDQMAVVATFVRERAHRIELR